MSCRLFEIQFHHRRKLYPEALNCHACHLATLLKNFLYFWNSFSVNGRGVLSEKWSGWYAWTYRTDLCDASCLAQDGNRFQVLDSGSCHIHDTFESRHFDSPKYSQNWNVLLPAIIRCAFLHCSEHRFHLHETIIHTKPYLLSYNVHVSKNHAR